MKYVLHNKLLWYIAIANAFVYPHPLRRAGSSAHLPGKRRRDFSVDHSSWAYSPMSGGDPGHPVVRLIRTRCSRAAAPRPASCSWCCDPGGAGLLVQPGGNPTIDMMALVAIGFSSTAPSCWIGLYALELAPKKAAGTAAGFHPGCSVIWRRVAANAHVGYTVDHFWLGRWLHGADHFCGASIVLLAMTPSTRTSRSRNKAAADKA